MASAVRNILIVEDSSMTRSMIRSVVEDMEGMETYEASSGFIALKMLPERKYDLIITDINMPDINGFEFVTFIKNNDRYKDVPVVFISTERSKEDIEKGMSLGAASYLTKPFKSEELQAVVRKTLSL